MQIKLETLLPFEKIIEMPNEVFDVVETHGKAILLKNNAPVYVITKPNSIEETGNHNDVNKDLPKYAELTLQEAMRVVLQDAENNEMHAADLADEVFKRGLYTQKNGSPAKYNQIRARCNHYPELFEALPRNTIKLKKAVAEARIEPKFDKLTGENERMLCNMAKGDRYIDFTNFLKMQHTKGIDEFSLSFSEIDSISKNPFPPSTRKYPWGNTAKHSYSISWLKAGYVVRADIDTQRACFSYDLRRANELLSR